MLKEVWYTKNGTKSLAYEYTYTASGQVYKFIDHTNGKTTTYKYNDTGTLAGFFEYDSSDNYHDFSAKLSYDRSTGFLTSKEYAVNHLNGSAISATGWSHSYVYDEDGTLSHTYLYSAKGSGIESFTYDDLDRLTSKTLTHTISGNLGTFTNTVNYTYYSSNGYTSGLVGSYSSAVSGQGTKTYTYSYDADGANITKIVYSSGEEITYEYDELGQLVKEVNDLLSYAYTYTYDDAGNITSRTTFSGMQTNTYEYTGDRLTSFNGVAITYDANGNPLSYYNGARYYFTWSGRQLAEATKGTSALTFTYNDEGIRTSKTKNGVKTTYYLSGSQIVAEETSNNITLYIYDSQGSPIGMQYHGANYAANVWDTFWFEKNLQGDIVAVYSGSGTKLVEYVYDAWGNHLTNYFNGGASTQASNNPFRYRGYYYDSDLELYCVGTRYYDSVIGRWINADTPSVITATPDALTDKNLYAYCDNNPVSRADYGGEFWHLVIGGAIGGFVGGLSAAISGGDTLDIVFGIVSGVASGVLTSSGVGVVGQVIGSATISMAANAASQIKNIVTDDTNSTSFDVGDMLFDGAVSASTALWGKNGASHGNTAGINASWKQFFKKGIFNSNAQKYFYKTAHNSAKEFVLTSVIKSSGKNAIGSAVITIKNKIAGAFR